LSIRLFLSNLKIGRWGLIAWVVLLFLYGWLTMALYPSIAESASAITDYMENLPEIFKAAFGYEEMAFGDFFLSPESFATMEFLILWPLLIGVYGIFSCVNIARETERGTLDLLLAQPVERYNVLITKFTVFVFAALLITVVSLLGLLVGTALINETVDTASLALALFEALLLVMAIASFTTLFSVIFLEPRKSLLVAGVVTGGSYILNFIVPLLNPSIEWLRNLSIFYHYKPNDIISSSSLNITAVIVYIAIIVVCFIASLIIFQRRDLNSI
jgi:ABC-2 type transport system permease protein